MRSFRTSIQRILEFPRSLAKSPKTGIGSLPLWAVLVIPFVLQLLGGVGLVWYLTVQNGRQAVRSIAEQLIDSVSQQVDQRLIHYLEAPRIIHQLNQTQLKTTPFESLFQDLRPQQLSQQFWQQKDLFKPSVSALYIGSETGEFVGLGFQSDQTWQVGRSGASTHYRYENYRVNPEGIPTDRISQGKPYDPRQRPWYQAARSAKGLVWSPIYWDFKEKRQKITLGAPILSDDRQLQGVLGVDFVLSHISDFLKTVKVEKTGSVFILDSSGRLVASSIDAKLDLSELSKASPPIATPVSLPSGTLSGYSPPPQINRIECNPDRKPCLLLRDVLQQVLNIGTNTPANFQFKTQDQPYFGRIQAFTDPIGLQWRIIVIVPESDFMAEIEIQNRKTQWLCVGALLLAIISGLLTARWLSEPIRRLSSASNALKEGQVTQALKLRGVHEVQQLTLSFNQMAEEIDRSRRQLEDYAQSLEAKVTDRTHALEDKNTALQTALQTLTERQTQLIQAEKLAVLGQLIASVAHDLNTPLSVIYSAASHVIEVLGTDIIHLPELLRTLEPDRQQDFLTLLNQANASDLHRSTSRDRRQLRRKLTQTLINWGIPEAELTADTLADCGIESPEPWREMLQTPQGPDILRLVYQISSLSRSARNVSQAAERANKVVLALKHYSHSPLEQNKVNIHIIDNIETALTLYHSALKQGIEVLRNYGDSAIAPIACYPDDLNQVWTNLIQNAIHAMQGEGTLTIDITPLTEGIEIRISDTGHGIPADVADRIFDPFFTTKPFGEGNGLGLSIVKKAIDKHHGKIAIETSSTGTTFIIQLPNETED